ncbi:MAG: hypothetical protein OXO50_08195 [Caldilineaceae bacterium]|nr:hypothetical protein [Caldilineaceae bacterium]
MSNINISQFRTGPKLDQYRSEHPNFVQARLVIEPEGFLSKHNLNETYAEWRGITKRDKRTGRRTVSQLDLYNLYILLKNISGVKMTERGFKGIRLKSP